jgi:hypothetical protein
MLLRMSLLISARALRCNWRGSDLDSGSIGVGVCSRRYIFLLQLWVASVRPPERMRLEEASVALSFSDAISITGLSKNAR